MMVPSTGAGLSICILLWFGMIRFVRQAHGFRQLLDDLGPRKARGFILGSRSAATASSSSSHNESALSREEQDNESVENTSSDRLGSPRRAPFYKIYYNDVYEVKLPPNHRFPMGKYRKTRLVIQDWVDKQLLAAPNSAGDGHHQPEEKEPTKVRCEFQVSPLSTVEDLSTTHDPSYVKRFMMGNMTKEELRNIGFPWGSDVVDRHRSSVGGTVAAACSAVDEWLLQLQQQGEIKGNRNQYDRSSLIAPWGAHVAGGTHHAFYDYGEGFSVFSDIAVASNVVLKRYPEQIEKILIIDLDVHQGNGNAALFRDRPEVFTFSIHCSANYFSEKQDSDLDIELPAGCTDETYLMTLHHWLQRLKRDVNCDLIFFQAGVDVLETDRLGRLALTPDGVRRRNEMVYKFAKDANVPLIITMGGGYPKGGDWPSVVKAHADVYIGAYRFLANVDDKIISGR